MGEYNLLTQRLLAEGYTADNYPDYVQLPGSCWGKNPLQNLHGGFEYTKEYRSRMVFETGCGLLVRGPSLGFGSMSYGGILWIPENNNPVICCPYKKDVCELRNTVLGGPRGGGLAKLLQCDCHQTNRIYEYEKSVDKIRDDMQKEKNRKYEEFVRKKGGHVCKWHTLYNEWTGEWKQDYDPMVCAAYCMNIGKDCDLTHKPVSRKKGNVFYDVKITRIRHDGTLFDGQETVTIVKGARLFETMKSMTICEAAARRKKMIQGRNEIKYHAERTLLGTKVEVVNIRAERRESRDLMQDLQDIRDGIEVIHESDKAKQQKADKKARRQQAAEKRIRKLEKKLLETGYDALPEYSVDRIHADKWLGEKRIAELDTERQRLQQEKEKQPVQISLFDLPEMQEG